nr:immunoglobulin heavy chain junction region [Mus musculus]MBK4184444.1 immunoglobulin heavy chain junction region [Mus musculus]MBK4184449.1 immunoglobulin heavy chain junction region [Mus musculus]MBK4184450.1 immunoglobulin heavy chain junction region [Mus musculus]
CARGYYAYDGVDYW